MTSNETEGRVAVLVDCDNTTPEILDYALKAVAQYGRVVLRRGYGNHSTLANKWQEALVRLAFTPVLQYQYASGKNTADIALALDAIEAMFDQRADMFCLVTSDSDFAHLCRKLRERGAQIYIVGEAKTPVPLRNASDKFFEWVKPDAAVQDCSDSNASKGQTAKNSTGKAPAAKVPAKSRPMAVVEATKLLTDDAADGKVALSQLGAYLKRTDPAFSTSSYGHSRLLDMVKTYDLLSVQQDANGHWSVSLAQKE